MHMAAGYATVTGRGSGRCWSTWTRAPRTARWARTTSAAARVPLMLMAGRAPYTVRGELPGSRDNYVHFIQEPFDQAGIVRPYVKWEWTLPSGVITKEVLRRAHTIAHSDPPGPVYLMLPRETLAEDWDSAAVKQFPDERYGAVKFGTGRAAPRSISSPTGCSRTQPDPRHLLCGPQRGGAGADRSARARRRHPRVRVASARTQHLARIGLLSRRGGRDRERSPTATSACCSMSTCPGFPSSRTRTRTRGGRISTSMSRRPSFRSGASPQRSACRATRVLILRQLLDAIEAKTTPAHRTGDSNSASTAITAEAHERRAKLAAQAAERGRSGRINPHYVCAELGKRAPRATTSS